MHCVYDSPDTMATIMETMKTTTVRMTMMMTTVATTTMK